MLLNYSLVAKWLSGLFYTLPGVPYFQRRNGDGAKTEYSWEGAQMEYLSELGDFYTKLRTKTRILLIDE